MATEGNDEDIGNLSDDEIEARQRAEDGEDASHDPATVEKEEEVKDPAQAATAAPPPQPTPEPTPAPTPAPSEDAQGGKIKGVLSKDGERVLPYGALRAARDAAARAEKRASRAEAEAATAKQQLEDLKSGKTPIEDVTEDDVRQMEADFPEQGAKYRRLWERAQASPTQATEPVDETDTRAASQELIDQVPLLLDWQHNDEKKFARAVEHDALLLKSPKWADKPALERFTEATRRTADEYDIPFEDKPKPSASAPPPAATPAPTAASIDPAQAATRKPPESLSDFKGGATPDHGSLDITRATPQALLRRFEDMSDEEIDAQLAKLG